MMAKMLMLPKIKVRLRGKTVIGRKEAIVDFC